MAPKDVSDVHVQDAFRPERTGGTTPIKRVRFFVGTHGPFFLEYTIGEYSAERVNRDMENQVRMLREIAGPVAGGS